MKCANCPLYAWWNNESDKGEACGIFGDGWDNQLQYEDKTGRIVGCYVDRHYIEKVDERKYVEVSGVYFCDPDRNGECKKRGCFKNGGPCRLTTDVRFRQE